MITGAASADAAVLVIAANEGVREQSRRHAYLLSLLGIKQIVVVGEQDGSGGICGSDRFARSNANIESSSPRSDSKRAASFPLPPGRERVANRSGTMTAWYAGPTLLEALDELEAVDRSRSGSRSGFCVQDVYRFDERRIIAGRIESGTIAGRGRTGLLPG